MAIDNAGELVFQGQSGSANLASTPIFRLRQNLSQAVRGAPEPTCVCACFAGLLTEEDRSRAVHLLQELFPNAKLHAEPDYTAAYWASEPGTDICLIAGTGSLVCSWNGTRIVKSGGRGYLLGDYGSAYTYGKDALLHYLNDPNSASPPLRKTVHDLFGHEDEPSIISRLYHAPSPQAMIAKLAKPLAADAKFGAEYAHSSLQKNASMLADIVSKHIEQHIESKHVKICLAGGLWKTSQVFIDAFESALSKATSRIFELDRIKHPPVHGAVKLAREMAS